MTSKALQTKPRGKKAAVNFTRTSEEVSPVVKRIKPPSYAVKSVRVHYLRDMKSFTTLYRKDPFSLIEEIKRGVPASAAEEVATVMNISKDRFLKSIGISKTTVERKQKEHKHLSPGDSERVIGSARLIGQVQQMVEQSGEPEGFNAGEWFADWIEQPHPALGGEKPAKYLDTSSGIALVSNLLNQIYAGVYA